MSEKRGIDMKSNFYMMMMFDIYAYVHHSVGPTAAVGDDGAYDQ